MADKGVITREDIMKDDAIKAPLKLSENLKIAQKSVEELINIAGVYNQLSKDFKGVKNTRELIALKKDERKASQDAIDLLKKQRQAELAHQRIKEKEIAIKNKQLTLENKIQTQKRRSVTLTQQEKYEQSLLNREEKEQAIITSNLTGAYRKLNLQRTQAKKRLLDLIASEKSNTKELQKARREYDRLDKKVRKADESVGDFSKKVGNYKTGVSGLTGAVRGLVGAFGVVEGIRLAIRIGADLYEVSRQAKGVEFAFKNIGLEGQFAFDKIKRSTRGLLSDLDIKKSIIEFDNFNLSASELDKVLEFVSVRSTQTGKSFEYLRDSAIEAISKESVRRADNLGLSQKELNDKIKEGATFLEAFTSIAQREVAEAGGILDEAADSQQQFNAALENFKVSAGSGFIKKFTDSIYDMGTALVSVMGDINDTSDGFLDFVGKMFQATQLGGIQAIQTEAAIKREIKSRIPIVNKILKLQEKQGVIEIQRIKNKDKLLKTNSQELKLMLKKLDLEVNGKKEKPKTEEENKAQEQRLEKQKRLNESLKKSEFQLAQEQIKINIAKNRKVATDDNVSFQRHLEANIQLKKELLKLNDSQINEEQRLLKEKLDNNLISENEYNVRLQILAIKRKALNEDVNDEITKNLQGHLEHRFEVEKNKLEETQNEKKKQTEKELQDLKESEEQKRQIIGQTSDFIADALGLDSTNIQRLMNGIVDGFDTFSDKIQTSLAVAADVINSIANISEGFSQDRIAQIDFEIEKNDEKYNKLLDNETLTLEQRALLEAQRDREQDKLEKKKRVEKTKQAKLQKANTLTQIALQTSLGVISALAQVPKFDFGVSATLLAGIIGTIGAVQFALAAARPVPKFKTGTENAPKGWAIVDEEGAEIHTDKKGNIKSFGSDYGANYRYLEQGDKIIPHKESISYREIMAQNILSDINTQNRQVTRAQQLTANDNRINEMLLASYMARALQSERGAIKKEIKQGLKNVGVTVDFKNYNSGNTIYKNEDW